MSENAEIETGSNADPKAQGDPSGESVLGATPCSPEVGELLAHFFGLCSGTVGDGILAYLNYSDCSPRTRQRIREWANSQAQEREASL